MMNGVPAHPLHGYYFGTSHLYPVGVLTCSGREGLAVQVKHGIISGDTGRVHGPVAA